MINKLKKYNLNFDKTDIKSIIYSLIIINFAFLYHSLNLIWGNHDVTFIKDELLLSSGLFEGRFTQFIPYRLLTNGQILPILNNLIGFSFLTLGLWVLARYWNLKKNKLYYTLFISFFATLPYTLSWLYFTFITISCMLWVLLAILGLHLSSFIYKQKSKSLFIIISTLCFYLPFGGYPPIINTIFVCLSAKILISYALEKKSLKEIFSQHIYTILCIIIAYICFKATFLFIKSDSVYNLQTLNLKEIPQKLISIIFISFNQFIISLPYMEKPYKITLLVMSLTSIIGLFTQSLPKQNKFITFIILFITILCTSTTTFLATAPTQYVARIDFYGLGFLYLFFIYLALSLTPKLYHSLGIIFLFILIPFNILNDYRALTVWKQGFDAEYQILDRVVERIENHKNFNPRKQYRYYQVGDIALRPAFYDSTFDFNDVFLYSHPYLAMWQGKNLIEFYSPFNYVDNKNEIYISDITPQLYTFMKDVAKPWPHQNSIYVDDKIIVVIYRQNELNEFVKQIQKTLSSTQLK